MIAAQASTTATAGAAALGGRLFELLNEGDRAGALALFAPDAAIEIVPAQIKGLISEQGARFFGALLDAFPDLLIQVRSTMGTPGLAVFETKLEGTQAADFLGILNQEKHLDIDQAWMVWAHAGAIARVRAYWCQNQLYRRLAVKRLDRISILG